MFDEQAFENLCLEAGYLLGADDPPAFASSGELIHDGVHIGLFLDSYETAGTIHCYVDLGPVDTERRADIYEALLELNIAVGRRSDGVFGLDRESGHVIVSTRIKASRMRSPPDLADYVDQLKKFSLELRTQLMTGHTMPAASLLAPFHFA